MKSLLFITSTDTYLGGSEHEISESYAVNGKQCQDWIDTVCGGSVGTSSLFFKVCSLNDEAISIDDENHRESQVEAASR